METGIRPEEAGEGFTHQEGEAGRGIGFLDRPDGWGGKDDIADVAQLDEKDIGGQQRRPCWFLALLHDLSRQGRRFGSGRPGLVVGTLPLAANRPRPRR